MKKLAALAGIDDLICFSLYSTGLAMDRLYRQALRPLKLTYAQYLVMLVLWERDAITVSDLGDRLFLDSATISPMLRRLGARGLVSRQRAAEDERQVYVTLTPASQALRAKAVAVQEEMNRIPCKRPDVIELKRRLEALRATLLQVPIAQTPAARRQQHDPRGLDTSLRDERNTTSTGPGHARAERGAIGSNAKGVQRQASSTPQSLPVVASGRRRAQRVRS